MGNSKYSQISSFISRDLNPTIENLVIYVKTAMTIYVMFHNMFNRYLHWMTLSPYHNIFLTKNK